MKNKIRIASTFILSVIFLTTSSIAFADTQSTNSFFSKSNNQVVENKTEKMANITDKKEIKRLMNLGFTEEEIKTFSASEYERYKDVNGKIVSNENKYYKVTKGKGIEEITAEQATKDVLRFNTEKLTKNGISVMSDGSDTEQTSSWLTMTTTVSDQGNKQFLFKNSFKWLTAPFCTFEDVVGLTHSSSISNNQNSEYLKYTYDKYSKTIPSEFIGTDNVFYWTADKKNDSGYAFKYDLLSETTSGYYVVHNSGYLVYTGTATPSNFVGSANAFGHYAHQQVSVSFGIDLVSGNMSANPSASYDEAIDTDAQFYVN